MMRAITVRQPWAWAILHAGKVIENRSRNIVGSYRGLVAIHAARAIDGNAFNRVVNDRRRRHGPDDELPRGLIVGTARIADVHRPEDGGASCRPGSVCSPWAFPGCWHIRLVERRALPEPVACTGFLALWRVPDDVEAVVRAQLGKAA